MTNESNNPNTHDLIPDAARYRNSVIDAAEEVNFRASQFFRAFNSPAPNLDDIQQYATNLSGCLNNFAQLLKPYLDETI